MIERYGTAIGLLLKSILEDLNLTAEQQKRAPEIVRRRLMEAEGLEARTDTGRSATRCTSGYGTTSVSKPATIVLSSPDPGAASDY